MDIKVLGPGCAKCEEAERLVREVIAEIGAEATIEKVKNLNEFARYGVFSTPAVVIDGQVKCVGTVPSKDELRQWLSA